MDHDLSPSHRSQTTPEKAAGRGLRRAVCASIHASLFDREDGKAADWPLIAETLLREAFYALDQAPTDERAALLLRGIHSAMTA
jgi:DNA-directed RNA polymerase specialized sigma24 family protein